MTLIDLLGAINRMAPFERAESWDNVGLLVGGESAPVTAAVVALDVTPAVLALAEAEGAEVIVAHHPLLFSPIRSVESGSLLWRCVERGVAVIAAHTNLDVAPGGVGEHLARALGLSAIPAAGGFVQIADLPAPVKPSALAAMVKDKLDCDVVRFCKGASPVSRVGFAAGSGAEFLGEARRAGCQALVTGDVKHSAFVAAAEWGMTLVDAGHFATERIYVREFARRLSELLPGCRFIPVEEAPPYRVI